MFLTMYHTQYDILSGDVAILFKKRFCTNGRYPDGTLMVPGWSWLINVCEETQKKTW